jgi:hypothetical protein
MVGVMAQPARAQVTQPSLYERLGGVEQHRDSRRRFHRAAPGERHAQREPSDQRGAEACAQGRLKFHVTALACAATGGKCADTGRPMKESHEKLNVSHAEWDAMVTDFEATLDKFNVPQAV